MAGNGTNIFDYVDDFQKAGMSQEQANVLARALQNIASENAATKTDLELTKLELKKDIEHVRMEIENVRADLKRDIAELGSTLTIRAIMIAGLFTGLIGLIVKFL